MNEKNIEKRIDDKRSAKVSYDEYGAHLHTLNNGYQWGGTAIYSVEVAEAAIDVLLDYVDVMKGRKEGPQ